MEINESPNNSELSLRNEEILVAVSKKIIHRLVVRIVPPTIKLDKNLWCLELIKLIFLKKTLHKACEYGDLKFVEEFIQENKDSCLEKNKFGFTPLHIAAQKGRIDVAYLILKYCPEVVKEVTAKTMRTCVHVAINHNQIETITVSLPLNSGGSVALDISYDLPHLENMDFKIDRIGEELRAMIDWDLTKQKIIHSDLCSDNGSYNIRQLENMDIEIDRTLQQCRATLA
ncbi:Ankyrin-1 [Camellia lanceoleosa]|uniref:Ankyrin-1 n=1 Tax=Camellia lanceoleosa TaxID=1840588 RepID=A0ACC0J026_9ERIC|nr:Ankyrin-1 [Camellia lanceoleosa]